MIDGWTLASSLLGGTPAMRSAGESYLVQNEAESDKKYKARLAGSWLYGVFASTIDTMAAKPFKKPVVVEDVPESIEVDLLNIDNAGRDLTAFSLDVMTQVIAKGITFILVDYPSVDPDNERSKQDEIDLNLRPYWVHIKPEDLIAIDFEYANGVLIVNHLRIKEVAEIPDGEFKIKQVEQVRVIYPDRFEVWREGAKAEWVVVDQGVRSVNKITLAPVYAKQTVAFASKPPLIPLMEKNVEHWQSSSEQRNILHVARTPLLFGKQLTTIDAEGNPVKLTTDALIASDSADGELKFVEHSGKAIGAGVIDLERLESQMEALGGMLLLPDTTKTATEQRSKDSKGDSRLHGLIANLESALEQCLGFHGDWLGEDVTAEVSVYSDFSIQGVDFMTAKDLLESRQSGQISHSVYVNALKKRGGLPDTVDSEDMLEEIGGEIGFIPDAG